MTIDEIKRQMFIDSEEVCGNTMIDTYQAQEYVEQAYNKAIDDFAKLVEIWCWKHEQYNQDDLNTLMDIAEQLKEGVKK